MAAENTNENIQGADIPEAWKLMIDSMIKLIHASTKLMNSFNLKAGSANHSSSQCEIECVLRLEKDKSVVCAAVSAAKEIENYNRYVAQKLDKITAENLKLPNDGKKPKVCSCSEIPKIRSHASNTTEYNKPKADYSNTSRGSTKSVCSGTSTSKPQLYASPISSKEKADITHKMVEKLNKAQEEIHMLRQELQKVQYSENMTVSPFVPSSTRAVSRSPEQPPPLSSVYSQIPSWQTQISPIQRPIEDILTTENKRITSYKIATNSTEHLIPMERSPGPNIFNTAFLEKETTPISQKKKNMKEVGGEYYQAADHPSTRFPRGLKANYRATTSNPIKPTIMERSPQLDLFNITQERTAIRESGGYSAAAEDNCTCPSEAMAPSTRTQDNMMANLQSIYRSTNFSRPANQPVTLNPASARSPKSYPHNQSNVIECVYRRTILRPMLKFPNQIQYRSDGRAVQNIKCRSLQGTKQPPINNISTATENFTQSQNHEMYQVSSGSSQGSDHFQPISSTY